MKTIWVLCEGPTEEKFISSVVAPALRNVTVKAMTLGGNGGDVSYVRVERDVCHLLKDRRNPRSVVTTFVDLYGLGKGFPGEDRAKQETDIYERVKILESELATKIVAISKCAPSRFFAYIQPHEFEALLFASPGKIAQLHQNWHQHTSKLNQALRSAGGNPEQINDSPVTAPSKRLIKILDGYQKTTHGPQAAKRIGLEKIEEKCRHFRSWMNWLRSH